MRCYPAIFGFVILALSTTVVVGADGPLKIVTLGDSITHGTRPGVKDNETFASLLQPALRKQDVAVEVTNVGIGGERTDQALKRLHKIIALKPHLVTIMYGTNDSYVDIGKKQSRITSEAYGKNLSEIIARLRKAGITPVLMTEPRWGKKASSNGVGEHPNLRLQKYMKVCRTVAHKTKTPLVDHFKKWTAEEKAGKNIGGWTTDQCHPNPAGHRILAELMVPIIAKTLKAN